MRTIGTSFQNQPIYASNDNFQHGYYSELRNRSTKHVPMDLTSKGALSFHNISYTIGQRQENSRLKNWYPSFMNREPKRQILDDVSGIFMPGMNAIMGPTGCGKSSLLDVLADRKDPSGLSGQVLIDGCPPPPSFKYIVGYVVQDDIISGTLTVRENLMFSANVRLSNGISHDERRERVTKIITDLGLESCADATVGTELLRGISGGERKRTCIGMELVLSPRILFLDEPTTGLDASTARIVIECLRKLSKNERTIIFSIHQPRYSIFKLLDTILLMCKGKNIYHGSPLAMLDYFNTQGYLCELHDNPADFALDVLIDASRKPKDLQKLNQAYLESEMHANINSLLRKQLYDVDLERFCQKQQGASARWLSTEIYYVSQRTLKNAIRNPQVFLSQILVAFILGLLGGLVFNDMKKTIDPGIRNRLDALFFITVTQLLCAGTALEPFEYVSGYYQRSTFFIAKLICDILPMRIIPSIIFTLLAYFMTGLQRSAGQFFVFLITILMASIFGSALCFFVSATTPIFAVASVMVALCNLIMVLFSGFIGTKSVHNWISWIEWFSAFRYSYNALAMNEFRNITFCLANFTNICPLTGSAVLKKIPIDYATNWNIWKNISALGLMAITFFLLAYIQLLRIKTTK